MVDIPEADLVAGFRVAGTAAAWAVDALVAAAIVPVGWVVDIPEAASVAGYRVVYTVVALEVGASVAAAIPPAA